MKKRREKKPHIYIPMPCGCERCGPLAGKTKRECLMCLQMVQFTAEHWARRWRDVPFGVKCACERCHCHNHQPRCKPCERTYQRRLKALRTVKAAFAKLGIDLSRIEHETYIESVTFNATKLTAREKGEATRALVEAFGSIATQRPVLYRRVGKGVMQL